MYKAQRKYLHVEISPIRKFRGRIYFYLPPCLRSRSNFRGSRISKNNERVRALEKDYDTGPFVQRNGYRGSRGNFYRFSVSQDSQLCSFHLESSIFFYHSAPLLLPCPSIFPQIGHSHKDFLTFFLTFFSLASSISISSYFYLFIYLFLVIPFFDREKEVLKFVRITMIFILDKMNDFVKLDF